MAWNDAPPTKAELQSSQTSNWANEPPRPEELNPGAYSALQSALMGAANQLNAAPVVGAAIQHPIEALEGASNPLLRIIGASEFKPEDTKDYNEARESLNKKFKQAQSDNPKSYLAGNVAGGLPLAAVLPEAAPGFLGGAALGAGLGAASGAGEALSNGQSVGGVAGQALGGAATGGLLGGAVGSVAKGLSSLGPEGLESTAASQAVGAFTPPKSDVRKILKAANLGDDPVKVAGDILNKPSPWLNGKSIVQAGAGKQDLLNNLQTAAENAGKHIGEAFDNADALGKKVVNTDDANEFINKELGKLTDPTSIGKFTLHPQTGNQIELAPTSLEADAPQFNLLKQIQRDIGKLGGTGDLSFGDAKNILSFIDRHAYDQKGEVANKTLNQLRGVFNNNIEDGLEQVAKESNNPDLFNNLMDAKRTYQVGKLLNKAAEGGVAKEISNNQIGLTDYMAGGFGHAIGGSPAGLAGMAANYLSRNYGNAVVAKGAQGLANAQRAIGTGISKGLDVVQQKAPPLAGKVLTSATPETLQNWAKQASASASPTMQNLGRIFNEAAGRDQIGRNALMFTVLQNPVYRDALHSVTSSDESVK